MVEGEGETGRLKKRVVYEIQISPQAEKDLNAVKDARLIRQIKNKIDSLQSNPCPQGVERIKGTTDEFYRIRSGDYRIIYEIDKQKIVVLVLKLGDRKDVYRRVTEVKFSMRKAKKK